MSRNIFNNRQQTQYDQILSNLATLTVDLESAATEGWVTTQLNNQITLGNTTESTSPTTGGVVVRGGLGVGKALRVGGLVYSNGEQLATVAQLPTPGSGSGYSAGSGLTLTGSQFSVNAAQTLSGILTITNTTASTASNDGSVVVGGGLGVAGDVHMNGSAIYMGNASSNRLKLNTPSNQVWIGSNTGDAAGDFHVWDYAAGRRILGWFRTTNLIKIGSDDGTGSVAVLGTADSSSSTTGVLTCAGGAGVSKNLYVGSSIYMAGNLVGTQSWANSTFQTALGTSSNVSIGTVTVNTTTDSSSSTTGALKVSGGVGIAKSVYVGGTIYMGGSAVALASAIPTIPTAGTNLSLAGNAYSTVSNPSFSSIGITSTSTAISSSTGAVTIAGGLGVGKNAILGGGLLVNQNAVSISPQLVVSPSVSGNESSIMFTAGAGGTGTSFILGHNVGTAGLDTFGLWSTTLNSNVLTASSAGKVAVLMSTQSTSTSTGCLVTNGGIGIGGNIYAAGNVQLVSSTQGIVLNAADAPLITRGHDPFTSGAYSGIGRWGLTQESGAITIFTPDNVASNLRYSTFAVNSTVSKTWLNIAGQTGICNLYCTTDTVSPSTGALIVSGGIGIGGSLRVGSASDATSSTTGSIATAGGLGVAKSLYVGANAYMAGDLIATQSWVSSNYTIWSPSSNLSVGTLTLNSTADSTSETTGALIVAGGMGLAKALYQRGTHYIKSASIPQLRLTNSTATGEASILFSSSTDYGTGSGANWYLGNNVGTGAGNFGLNSSVAGVVMTVTPSGNTSFAGSLTATGAQVFSSTAANLPTITLNGVGGAANTVGLNMSPWAGRSGGTSAKIMAVDDGASGAYIAMQCAMGSQTATATECLRVATVSPQVRVSPLSNGAESSIAFYQNTSTGGARWVLGHNTGSFGSDTFGIYNSTLNGTPFRINNAGLVTIANQPAYVNLPPWSSVTSTSFTANQSGWTAISGLTMNNSSFNGGTSTVTLVGKGKWHITGYVAADSVINIGSVNHIGIIITLSGNQIGHTQRWFNFSFGTGIHEFNTTIFTTVNNESLQILYKKSNNDITGAYINFEVTKAESYT